MEILFTSIGDIHEINGNQIRVTLFDMNFNNPKELWLQVKNPENFCVDDQIIFEKYNDHYEVKPFFDVSEPEFDWESIPEYF